MCISCAKNESLYYLEYGNVFNHGLFTSLDAVRKELTKKGHGVWL